MRHVAWALCFGLLANWELARAEGPQEKYPLGDDLRVLAADVESAEYRKLVLEKMLSTDLAAEWQRVETRDNPTTFAARHGGLERVQSDPDLAAAYARRVEIREKFLNLMREGFQRYKKPAPFDEGKTAERDGAVAGGAVAEAVKLEIVMPSEGAERQWPRFRGPTGQGLTDARPLPTEFGPEKSILWRTDIPGSGNSSPVIWGERIFLTSAEADGAERTLHCVRRADGKLLWSRAVPPHEVEPNVRDKNGFASATPITDGERVVAFFGNGGLLCCDMEGQQLWHHLMPGFDTTWGTGASPMFYHELVILVHDQNKADSRMLALDKRTGSVVWRRQDRKKAMGWSTPIVVRVRDHDELIYAGGESVKGYDPRTGRELWSLAGPTHEVIPGVLVGETLLYSASGRQGPTIALRPGGTGDVTDTHLIWRTVRGGPHVPSPILVNHRIFTVNDTGICTCLNADDGELLWQKRIRGEFSASPIESAGLIYCASEAGIVYVLRAADEFEVVAENDLGAPILASPAALDGVLYVRTAEQLWAIGEKK